MLNKEELRVIHLYNRAGFGFPLTDNIKGSVSDHIDSLISPTQTLEDLKVTAAGRIDRERFQHMSKEERQLLRKVRQEEMRELNSAWLNAMTRTEAIFREKLTFFWHGHFACRNGVPVYMEEMINMLRSNALTSFRTLLHAITKNTAMLQFLNNQQNRKSSPNENFARELLELFTLGRGHYSEEDIKAAARAFTGWGFDEAGVFVFREQQHDFGEKTFLGQTGKWNGDDIIDIILQQKQCALYITRRFCDFFAGKTDNETVHQIASEFYLADYDIRFLARSVFGSEWFYKDELIGNRIKSPVELLVPLMRDFRLVFRNPSLPFVMQRIMGQVLLFPPNVGGWPGGRSWIDGSLLVYRMKLSRVLLYNDDAGINVKDDGDDNGFVKMESKLRNAERLKVESDWNLYIKAFENMDETAIYDRLRSRLICGKKVDKVLSDKYTSNATGTEYIKSMTLHLMSLPEYQLC